MNEYAKALKGVPRVRLLDGKGREIAQGYYFAFPKYNICPVVFSGEKPEDKISPLREGIVTYDQGDWNLPNTPRFLEITPPHRMEVIAENATENELK